jgi:hypothetical protein
MKHNFQRALAYLLFLPCLGCKPGGLSATPRRYSVEQLVVLIQELEPWSASKDYSTDGWKRAVRAAKVIQKSNPTTVEEALGEYSKRYADHVNADHLEMSKPFLLMRLVFQLPEPSPKDPGLEVFCWNQAASIMNDDGTFNASWPLRWVNGKPTLVQQCEGANGLPYPARGEYRKLMKTFTMRDLGPDR